MVDRQFFGINLIPIGNMFDKTDYELAQLNRRERIGLAELVPLSSLRLVRKLGFPLLAARNFNSQQNNPPFVG